MYAEQNSGEDLVNAKFTHAHYQKILEMLNKEPSHANTTIAYPTDALVITYLSLLNNDDWIIDSGAMYRAVTLYSIENGIFQGDRIDAEKLKSLIKDIHISFRLNPETGRPDTYLNGVNVENKIRTMEVSSRVSPIATLDFVREAMVAQQQEMGKAKGIVMDGRDIGTTVFPDAELKIFVTATPEIRAQRRYDELKAKGEEASFDEILENVKQRDYIDQNRDVSPLRKASDALLLDNSHLSISQQKEWLAEQFERVIKEKN